MKYTTIDRIFNQVNRIKPDGFNEIDIIEWTGEALDFMATPKLYEESICYLEVSNYQASMPLWTHKIIQIARDNDYEAEVTTTTGICPAVLSDTSTDESDSSDESSSCSCGCNYCSPNVPSCYYLPNADGYPVIVNQLGEPLTEYELAFYRPFTDVYATNFTSGNLSSTARFTPIRLAEHTFFNSLVCQQYDSTGDLYNNSQDEYKIIEGSVLRFSFETGGIVISYLKQQLDDDGYPKIPDDVSVIKAIIAYIRLQYTQIDYYNYRQGSEGRLQKAELDWHWYCGQVKCNMLMPSGVDEWQNLLEGRNYLFPRNHYYGFFGYLGKSEQRTFLNNTNRK